MFVGSMITVGHWKCVGHSSNTSYPSSCSFIVTIIKEFFKKVNSKRYVHSNDISIV